MFHVPMSLNNVTLFTHLFQDTRNSISLNQIKLLNYLFHDDKKTQSTESQHLSAKSISCCIKKRVCVFIYICGYLRHAWQRPRHACNVLGRPRHVLQRPRHAWQCLWPTSACFATSQASYIEEKSSHFLPYKLLLWVPKACFTTSSACFGNVLGRPRHAL